jgi:hypothetical protein
VCDFEQWAVDRPAHVALTPEPPYYAVIFTSQRTEGDRDYEAMAQAMFELPLKQPGCLGAESVRDVGGLPEPTGIAAAARFYTACQWRLPIITAL